MFKNKISQRDLYVTNPTEHFLGSFSQEPAVFSQNASSSDTHSAPISQPEENSQRFSRDWQFGSLRSNQKGNYVNPKLLHKPVAIGCSRDSDNSNQRLMDMRNEAVQRDIIEMLQAVLENQKALFEGQELKENRNILTAILETQKTIIHEQKSLSAYHQDNSEQISNVKQPVAELGEQVAKILHNQQQESARIQAAFDKHLKVQTEASNGLKDILRMGHLQDSFDKALNEHKQDMQIHFQKQMASFNMDIIKAFQSHCLRSLESTITNLFSEYFGKIMELLKMELVDKMEKCQSYLQKANESRDRQNMQWMENALGKLQSIHNSKSNLNPKTVNDSHQEYSHPTHETMKFQKPSLSVLSDVSNFAFQTPNMKESVCNSQVRQHSAYSVMQAHQSWTGCRGLEHKRSSFPKVANTTVYKDSKRKGSSRKSYLLRSGHKMMVSPQESVHETKTKQALSDLESSPGVSFINSHTNTPNFLFKKHKSYGQSRRFSHSTQDQVDDIKWI